MPHPWRSRPTWSTSVLRSAALSAALCVACGRTGLDDPVDVTGAAGATEGSAGAIGTGGVVGTAGFTGTTGFVGGTAGLLGTAGTPLPDAGACANGTCTPVTCTEGATMCASSQVQQTCVNGAWASPVGCYVCVGDACAENTKHVFLTSQVFSGGALGGIGGADAICQSLAQAAGLTGPGSTTKYIAWLSDSTDSPANRFPKDAGPYRLVDGTEIASNWTNLTQEGIVTSGISVTELGTPPGSGTSACGPTAVWTDTKSDGTLNDVQLSCDDWSNQMGAGAALGFTVGGSPSWTDACMETFATTTAPCAQTAALYCFEQ